MKIALRVHQWNPEECDLALQVQFQHDLREKAVNHRGYAKRPEVFDLHGTLTFGNAHHFAVKPKLRDVLRKKDFIKDDG